VVAPPTVSVSDPGALPSADAMTDASALPALLDDLVAANRILAERGILDGFGHVSARDPRRAGRFLLSRSLAPALVTREDVMTFDLDGAPVDGDARTPYLERFLHGAIYRRRPDVQAIVHSHSAAVIPFTASSVPLRAVHHVSGFLGTSAPVFDIRTRFGATDMLVRSIAQGEALAETLGTHAVVLMRGHGFCTVGPSVPVATYRAIYTESNAAVQRNAIALGGAVTYLDADEARLADAVHVDVVLRPWSLWKARTRPDKDA
jgi:ribulose-5-phosphate 4-epimerase/fuculose-1-phosphate aldolase